jgi:hypothetical protein
VPRLCEVYTGICLTTEEIARKTSFRVAIHKYTRRIHNHNIILQFKLRLSDGHFTSSTPTKIFYHFLQISDTIRSNFSNKLHPWFGRSCGTGTSIISHQLRTPFVLLVKSDRQLKFCVPWRNSEPRVDWINEVLKRARSSSELSVMQTRNSFLHSAWKLVPRQCIFKHPSTGCLLSSNLLQGNLLSNSVSLEIRRR